MYWPIGIIIETYTGNDELVRVVKTKPEKKDYSSSYCEIEENSIETKLTFIGGLSCVAISY